MATKTDKVIKKPSQVKNGSKTTTDLSNKIVNEVVMFLLFLAIATDQKKRQKMGVLGQQTKNKYISVVFHGCRFGGRFVAAITNRTPAEAQQATKALVFCAYVLFTTIRENSQMVPVCTILAALLSERCQFSHVEIMQQPAPPH